MKEAEWAIDTPDGAKIHGVTSQAGEKPSEKVIVMVHGLTGWIADHPAPLTHSARFPVLLDRCTAWFERF